MTGDGWDAGDAEPAALRLRRLALDNDDLRAENARLKGSIGERQDEIVALGERVGRLHADHAERAGRLQAELDAARQTLDEIRDVKARRLFRRLRAMARRFV